MIFEYRNVSFNATTKSGVFKNKPATTLIKQKYFRTSQIISREYFKTKLNVFTKRACKCQNKCPQTFSLSTIVQLKVGHTHALS